MPKWGRKSQIGLKGGQQECKNAIKTIEKPFIN
jgi:hypothetical protein